MEENETQGFEPAEELTPREAQGDGEHGPRRPVVPLRNRVIAVVALALIALASAFPLAGVMSSPETYAHSIERLDDKAKNVTGLVGVTTAMSFGVGLIPNAGAPVADKLLDIATNLGIVLAAIYLEKYLLTIFGLAACRVLIPLACVLAMGFVLLTGKEALRLKLRAMAVKLLTLALAMMVVVPASVAVSDLIEGTFNEDVTAIAQEADTDEGTSSDAAAGDQAQGSEASSEAQESSGDALTDFTNWLGGVGQGVADALGGAGEALTSSATGAIDAAESWISKLIETFAVMIVTNCVLPILVLVFFVWLVNVLLGTKIQVPGLPGAAPVRSSAGGSRSRSE